LVKPEDEANEQLWEVYEKWMEPELMIEKLKSSGVNVFPAKDSVKFVSVQEKVCYVTKYCF